MTVDEKLEELLKHLTETFPEPDFTVLLLPAPDKDLHYCFHIDYVRDPLAKSRRLRISRAAVDDLDPSEIIALLQHPGTENRWKQYGVNPFSLQYDVAKGIFPPSPSTE